VERLEIEDEIFSIEFTDKMNPNFNEEEKQRLLNMDTLVKYHQERQGIKKEEAKEGEKST